MISRIKDKLGYLSFVAPSFLSILYIFVSFWIVLLLPFDKLCAFRSDTCQRLSAHCENNIEALFYFTAFDCLG